MNVKNYLIAPVINCSDTPVALTVTNPLFLLLLAKSGVQNNQITVNVDSESKLRTGQNKTWLFSDLCVLCKPLFLLTEVKEASLRNTTTQP